MPKRWGWMLFGVAAGVAVGLLCLRDKAFPVVRFGDGKTTRIVKVSFGTNHVFAAEPFWKQALRKVLPASMEKPLGAATRYEGRTAYDSLGVFMENAPQDYVTGVQAIFPDGTVSQGRSAWTSRSPIILASYPREEKEVRLRFWDKQNGSVEVTVPNPRRVRRGAWRTTGLPQTNHICGTEIVLERWSFWRGYKAGELFFNTRSVSGGPTGWMRWRTTLFDPWGNWDGGEYSRSPALPGAGSNKEFKVLAEGYEYISAGEAVAPVAREYFMLPLNQRATNWGLRLVALLGPGTYEVSQIFAITNSRSGLTLTNAVRSNGASWLVECAQPALLSVGSQPVSELRIRERVPQNAGRVFPGRAGGSARDAQLIAQLFTPRLPLITTNLEAEVVVRWPAVEFYVEKPSDK